VRFKVKKIEDIIATELAKCLGLSNSWHGLTAENLADHLVLPPRSMRFRNAEGMGVGYRWLWVVIDERPGPRQGGYIVVYDPRCDSFGLAFKPIRKRWGTFLGFFGDLRTTLESM